MTSGDRALDAANEPAVKIGGRFPLELKGRDAFYLAVIGALGAALFLLMRFSLELWGRPFDIHTTLNAHLNETAIQHQAVADSINENTYVNSVCFNPLRKKECESLTLQMPETLRKKLK